MVPDAPYYRLLNYHLINARYFRTVEVLTKISTASPHTHCRNFRIYSAWLLAFVLILGVNLTLPVRLSAQSSTVTISGSINLPATPPPTLSALASQSVTVNVFSVPDNMLVATTLATQQGLFALTVPGSTSANTAVLYRVVPFFPGATFDQTSATIRITNNDFEIPASTFRLQVFSIGGTIALPATLATLNGLLPGGVTVRLSSTTGTQFATTQSISSGAYNFGNITPGTYLITPSFNGTAATFTPTSAIISVSNRDISIPQFLVNPLLPIISGFVTYNGAGLPNVPVTISGAGVVLTTTTAADGSFRVSVATSASYSINTSRFGFTFASAGGNVLPIVVTVPATGVNPAPVNIIGTALRYRIAGVVRTANGMPLPGRTTITVETITNATVIAQSVLVVDNAGQYSADVTSGTYRFTPNIDREDAAFTPPVIERTIVESTTLTTFIAAPRLYSVRGRIVLAGTSTVPNEVRGAQILLILANSSPLRTIDSAVIGSDGAFELRAPIRELGGTNQLYQLVIPSARGVFTFITSGGAPLGTDFGNFSFDVRGTTELGVITASRIPAQEFRVTGRLIFPNGDQLPGNILLNVAPLIGNTRTVVATNGNFAFTATNGTYTVIISTTASGNVLNSAFAYSLPRFGIVVNGSNVNVTSVTVTLRPITLSGAVRTLLGVGVTGAVVSVEGRIVQTLPLGTDGSFSLSVSGHLPGQNLTLTPIRDGLQFFPPSRAVIFKIGDGNLTDLNFRASSTTNTVPLFSITGRVTIAGSNGNIGILGISLNDGTRSAYTDRQGQFTIASVPNGRFIVTPTLSGFTFTPSTAAVVIANGRNTPATLNFVATPVAASDTNRAPVVNVSLNDITVNSGVSTPVPILPVFTDPNRDTLLYSTIVEDPTVLRTRFKDANLMIDALSIGNTVVTLIATDRKGGVASVRFRVTVSGSVFSSPPVNFVRPVDVPTNFNAAFIFEPQNPRSLVASSPVKASDGEIATPPSDGDELGAFNGNCECVGSVRWTGGSVVLPIWAEDTENAVPGMKINEPLELRVWDNILRKTRRWRVIYILSDPGRWPIDNAVASGFVPEDTPCTPLTISVRVSQTLHNDIALKAYPNPFTDRLTIEYSLQTPQTVSIELMNIFGQTVKTVLKAPQAAGKYSIAEDFGDIPSGMYLCKVQIGNDFTTMRISLVR